MPVIIVYGQVDNLSVFCIREYRRMVFDGGDGKSNDFLFINECNKGMCIIR